MPPKRGGKEAPQTLVELIQDILETHKGEWMNHHRIHWHVQHTRPETSLRTVRRACHTILSMSSIQHRQSTESHFAQTSRGWETEVVTRTVELKHPW